MALRALRAWGVALAFSAALTGCLSLGGKKPAQLFTLTAARPAAAGTGAAGTASTALAVLEPGAPLRLGVTRIPVQVTPSAVAYLKDAMWVEKPTRLFQRLVSETIRAKGTRLVVGESDLQYAAAVKLTGQLVDMGYDAATGSVVIRYDAVLQQPGGQVTTRRFESTVPGIPASAAAVGPALNQAANQVAGEVAEWVG
ncbi:MAG: ABC-type transport auxiliary lipoprotein family protein [Croceibacterium sp.]